LSWVWRAGGAQRSARGFSACGDATFIWSREPAGLFAVVDALGHGPEAAVSARIATGVLARSAGRPLPEIFLECDRALSGRRAVVLSAIQVREDDVLFAGIGNVEVYGPPGVPRPPTTAGMVGRGGMRTVREWRLAVEDGHRWVLVSDGISRRAAAGALRDAQPLPAEEAAARILQLAGREDDDAAVVVVDWSRR
jgi:negative regulator of sigma-B (phosphoserine phosphatase)